jgi:hypothetical protein
MSSQTLRRWTPIRSCPGDQEHAASGGPPASIHEDNVRELLAGGAGIHVDFHANRHFDDFRCFPGHFGSPYKPDELPPWLLNYRAKKSSPAKSFAINPRVLFCCSAIAPCGIVFDLKINQNGIKGFTIAHIKRLDRATRLERFGRKRFGRRRFGPLSSRRSRGTANKELVKFVRLPIPRALPH